VNRRVIIVGGGVIGLSIAQHLLIRGATPIVIDRGLFAKESSWAGAGYLDLRSAAKTGGDFFKLCRFSYDLFPEWISRIHRESGIDPEFLDSGSLDLAMDEKDEKEICSLEKKLKDEKLEGHWLTTAEAKKLEPGLSKNIRSAFYLKVTRQIRPPRLTRALLQILEKQGAILRENESVENFLEKDRRIYGVNTNKGIIEGDEVVLASGAWTGLWGEKFKMVIPVKPVRGQVIMFNAQPGLLQKIIFTSMAYLVPRVDGKIYVGSTLEEVGFDKSTTSEGMERLKQGAQGAIPSLAGALIDDSWAGLRPGSPDGWPIFGRLPNWEGVWVAAGHFTHGLLLSAATGQIMTQAILGEPISFDLSPFSMNRRPHAAVGL
jgi:glycine oxidase